MMSGPPPRRYGEPERACTPSAGPRLIGVDFAKQMVTRRKRAARFTRPTLTLDRCGTKRGESRACGIRPVLTGSVWSGTARHKVPVGLADAGTLARRLSLTFRADPDRFPVRPACGPPRLRDAIRHYRRRFMAK